MSNIENIFICLSAPLFIGAICVEESTIMVLSLSFWVMWHAWYLHTIPFAKVYYADVVTASLKLHRLWKRL